MTIPYVSEAENADVSPEEFVGLLPSVPLSASPAAGWRGVTLQHYQHPPGAVEAARVRDNTLVVNVGGEALVEERRHGERPQQRWATAGHMSLTPAGQPISRTFKGRPDVIVIHLAPTLIKEVASAIYEVDPEQISLSHRLAVPDAAADRLGKLLLSEAELHGPGTSLMADMLARSLVVHLLRYHSNVASLPLERDLPRPGGRLRRVLEHMNDHMEEALPLPQLASFSGLSQPQFARAFREATGKPPHRYLVDLRIERARRLLDESDTSIIEVGMQCGFQQPNHFATTFRKSTGMSPRTWRTRRR